ncbi:MAG TPA: isochorismate synthase [Flavobacterium sp.]|jgi:isochorismate synthase
MDELNKLAGKLDRQFDAQLPFVAYCEPDGLKVHALLGSGGFRAISAKSGFIFAPFCGSHIMIPEEGSEKISASFEAREPAAKAPEIQNSEDGKASFIDLVANGIARINNGDFSKVVLSRRELVAIDNIMPSQLLLKLLQAYPSAFRYVFFHPESGLWAGATPERLLQAAGNKFHTVALAGTQPFTSSAKILWQEKEKEEQALVTDFIVDGLKDIALDVEVSQPFTQRAGNLVHIKTDIHGVLKDAHSIERMLQMLHPTPAVCGTPRDTARDFILENEGYDREFYSGYLGCIASSEGKTAHANLYVNLRCMKISGQTASIYMGCGVTAGSDPEKEYIETVNKSMTMKRILAEIKQEL